MPVKLAKTTDERNYFHAPEGQQLKISLPTIGFLLLLFYFVVSGSLKMKALENNDEQKQSKWNKCLEDYVHNVCPVKRGEIGDASHECSELLECIKDGSTISMPEKSVFLIENTLKEAGAIGIPILLIYLLLKNLL